jgi:hypothetical protein
MFKDDMSGQRKKLMHMLTAAVKGPRACVDDEACRF